MINELKQFLRFITVAALLTGGAATAFSQTPAFAWQKTYGSIHREVGWASAKLNNSLYVHGGYIVLPNNVQCPYLVFTNANGDTTHTKRHLPVYMGRITGITANEDGSFVACGYYNAVPPNGYALFLIKFNQLGDIIWQRKFNQNWVGLRQQIIRVPDGYLLVADQYVDVIKTDLAGNLVWQKQYGLISGGQNITSLPDGSYFITGITHKGSSTTVSVFHRNNYWFLKMKPNGDTVYTKVIGNKTNFEIGYAAAPTLDGGVTVAGAYVPNITQTKRQGQMLKLDSLFNLQWEMKVIPLKGSVDYACEFFSIQPTISGDYVVAGQNYMNQFVESYAARITPPASIGGSATINWSQFFPGGEFFRDMLFEDDGSAVIGGTGGIGNSQMLAVKLTGLGQPYKPDFCAKPPVSSYTYQVKPDSIVIINSHKSKAGTRYGVISKWEYLFGDGNSFVTYDSLAAKRVAHKYAFGTMFMYGSPVKLIVTNNTFCTDTLTLYPFGGAPTGTTEATAANVEVKLYPNPMQQESVLELKNYSGKEKLSLEVTDMLGRKVAMPSKQLKANQWQLQRGGLSKGIYVYRLISSNKLVAQGKIVLTN